MWFDMWLVIRFDIEEGHKEMLAVALFLALPIAALFAQQKAAERSMGRLNAEYLRTKR